MCVQNMYVQNPAYTNESKHVRMYITYAYYQNLDVYLNWLRCSGSGTLV